MINMIFFYSLSSYGDMVGILSIMITTLSVDFNAKTFTHFPLFHMSCLSISIDNSLVRQPSKYKSITCRILRKNFRRGYLH